MMQNRRIDARELSSRDDVLDGFTDLTDQQQKDFRYTT
jgi:MFS transporter, ACS family, allantoate permease